MSRVVLITGASGGIGSEIAEAFALGGDKVAMHCHRHAGRVWLQKEKLAADGHSALAVHANVSVPAEVDGMFADVEAAYGPVEVLVNAAGFAQQKMFCDLTEHEWDRMFAVHVKGSFLCAQRALAAMVRARAGCIINISSMWGQVGASCEVHYSAAKAAVIGMTKALAKEVGPSGVRVNCIAPGVIDTRMLDGLGEEDRDALREETPLGTLGTPADVAAAALYLASDAARFVTGQVLGVNGGFVV